MRKLFLAAIVILIVLAALAFFGFRRNYETPLLSGRIVAENSQDWGSIPFGSGECAVVNNMWNKAAGGRGFAQSVLLEDVAGKQTIAWRWRAPFHFPPTIISQPEIICGNKPWDPKTRPDGGFPFQAGTRRLTASFDVNLRARGSYNLAFTLWGISALPASRSVISHEIMIWAGRNFLFPAGKRVDTTTVNGATYDVYIEEHQRDASGQNSNTWTYVAFVPQKPQLHGPLDVSAFLEYLVRRGTITRNHYLTSLELGNEVGPGAGVTEIQNFGIAIQ